MMYRMMYRRPSSLVNNDIVDIVARGALRAETVAYRNECLERRNSTRGGSCVNGVIIQEIGEGSIGIVILDFAFVPFVKSKRGEIYIFVDTIEIIVTDIFQRIRFIDAHAKFGDQTIGGRTRFAYCREGIGMRELCRH